MLARIESSCHGLSVRSSLRLAPLCLTCTLLGLSLVAVGGLGCAPAHQGYIEWRPGLSPSDFNGTFEITLDEYERFDSEGEGFAVLDRSRGQTRSDASAQLVALGESLSPSVYDHSFALRGVSGEGQAVVAEAFEAESAPTTQIDWLARSAEGRHAALISGSTLAVVVDGASAAVDLGRLLGADAGDSGHHFVMNVSEDELTVFALPEIGGAVTAFETGYLVSFRFRPGAREAWDITVARISITM